MDGRDFGDKDAGFHGVPFQVQVASTRHRRPRAVSVATRRKPVRVASAARSRVDRVQMRSAKAEWRIDRQPVSVPGGCAKHRPQRAFFVTSRVQCGISDGTDSTWQAVLSRRGPMGRASAASANSLESSIGEALVQPEFIGLQQPLGNLSRRWLKLDPWCAGRSSCARQQKAPLAATSLVARRTHSWPAPTGVVVSVFVQSFVLSFRPGSFAGSERAVFL
mmetsp:Transcript_39605/g.104969  ORF Transcript_39605/g.104969 Transcript_39605/m.104969 type:complete len:220 (-) Transcript_39605:18-677(-)